MPQLEAGEGGADPSLSHVEINRVEINHVEINQVEIAGEENGVEKIIGIEVIEEIKEGVEEIHAAQAEPVLEKVEANHVVLEARVDLAAIDVEIVGNV